MFNSIYAGDAIGILLYSTLSLNDENDDYIK